MMKISSIKLRNGYYTFKYGKINESGADFFSMESQDLPRPELIDAFKELTNLLLENFNIFKFASKMVAVHTIKLKYGGEGYEKEELSGFKLIGVVINKEQYTCKIETDMIKITKENKDIVLQCIVPLTKEAELYIKGNRGQERLFEGEDDSNEV